MGKFPFVVKNKSVVVEAASLSNALDRVLSTHPNKFVRTKYARNVATFLNSNTHMDLINAQVEAAKLSKTKRKELVYIVLEGDEFKVTQDVDIDKDDIYSVWRAGVKIESPSEDKAAEKAEAKTKNENNKTMSTETKKSAKKVAAKKAGKPAKKAAEKKEPKKAVATNKRGASFFFSDAQLKQVEAIMKKEELKFNAWVNKLVFAKID